MRTRLNLEERKERRRRVVARSKFALPSTITLISVLCGFSSVVMSINAAGDHPHYYFTWGAALLVLAGVFDGLDGRVARATNTATEFGVQLDSLADVLSFGMAPAILAYRYGFFQLGIADPQLRAVGWAASFFFIACGALRLARFNVQVGFVDSRFFVGMPIPVGAACVAAVILCWPSSPTSGLMAYLFAGGTVPGRRPDGLQRPLPQLQEALPPSALHPTGPRWACWPCSPCWSSCGRSSSCRSAPCTSWSRSS